MTVKDYENGKLIILSKAFDTRAKVLHVFYFVIFFSLGTTCLRTVIYDSDGLFRLFLAALGAALYICSFRFANKAALTEKLFVNPVKLELIQQGLYHVRKQSFDLNDITDLRHLTKSALSAHPLSGNNFDYLGFQTQQQVIAEMHGENRVAFTYKGQVVMFGDNFYSWDFSELVILLFDITGRDFRSHEEPKRVQISREVSEEE